MAELKTILGIDPGSRITGYGLIKTDGLRHYYLSSGCIRIEAEKLTHRLQTIFDGLREIIFKFQPDEVAIEQIFMHRNPGSALKLGQARGVAIVVAALHELEVAEYSARQVKQAVVGYGAAEKGQVQHMISAMLKLSGTPQADAADALAIAMCHALTSRGLSRIVGVKGNRRGRLR